MSLANKPFRHSAWALWVLLIPVSTATLAQQKPTLSTLDSRLKRVERVMDQSLLNQLQRIDALQRENRVLRGEIESLTYELNNFSKRNSDLYADTDRRITDLETSQGKLDFLNAEGGLSEDGLGGDLGGGVLDETGGSSLLDETAGELAAAAVVFVPEPGTAIPKASAADFGDGPIPPTGALRDTATQAEKVAYTYAYDLLARGQNDSAVNAFDEFLVQFPDGPYSDNAWYWQGEAKYAQRSFEDALRNFGVVVNSFPKSTKVPDARLKIGFALYEEQRYPEARAILTGVQSDYPGRSAAVLARKRLQKMDREGR